MENPFSSKCGLTLGRSGEIGGSTYRGSNKKHADVHAWHLAFSSRKKDVRAQQVRENGREL